MDYSTPDQSDVDPVTTAASLPDLIRQSIVLEESMDARVKPRA